MNNMKGHASIQDGMYVMNIDGKYDTSITLTLNVARLKEFHICVALHLVTLEKPAWKIPL
jgi:hypothetical protein